MLKIRGNPSINSPSALGISLFLWVLTCLPALEPDLSDLRDRSRFSFWEFLAWRLATAAAFEADDDACLEEDEVDPQRSQEIWSLDLLITTQPLTTSPTLGGWSSWLGSIFGGVEEVVWDFSCLFPPRLVVLNDFVRLLLREEEVAETAGFLTYGWTSSFVG